MNTQKSNQQQNKSNVASAKSDKTIVLVHGGFVDGSGWAGVHKILKNQGYNVLVVQNATKSLADDVATTKAAIESLNSEVVLVGHSWADAAVALNAIPTDRAAITSRFNVMFLPRERERLNKRLGDQALFAPARRRARAATDSPGVNALSSTVVAANSTRRNLS